MVWSVDTKELMIGDGKTKLKHLKGISNVCKAPNGKLYGVSVDNFGQTTVSPLKMKCYNLYVD